MSQDFANAEAIAKVMGLFMDLEGNLHSSRAEMDRVNAQQIETYNHFMMISQDTID